MKIQNLLKLLKRDNAFQTDLVRLRMCIITADDTMRLTQSEPLSKEYLGLLDSKMSSLREMIDNMDSRVHKASDKDQMNYLLYRNHYILLLDQYTNIKREITI